MNHSDLVCLINFVQGKISFDEWLSGGDDGDDEVVDIKDIPSETREHEEKHSLKWREHGVKTTFHLSSDGFYYTKPNLADIKKLFSTVGKNRFIEIFTEVVSAPAEDPKQLESTDEKQWLILSGKIKTEEELIAFRLSKL